MNKSKQNWPKNRDTIGREYMVYEKWNAWEDPEDLSERENNARMKADQARKRTLCNHDHSAEQKLMDMSTTEKLDKCEGFRRLGTRSVSLSSSADLF
jgi:hypothetical protein